MATFPPPYSPRDARRQARDYARMQQAQFRAQYGFFRRRPSFVGPLLLITVGVIALLIETGRLSSYAFWPWYARWWPLLLVLIGLGLLGEYFIDRNNPLAPRRSIGGIVWLIILLSILGGGSRAAYHFGPWADHLDNFGDHQGWMSMMGEEHAQTRTLVQPIGANGVLTIVNARGGVEVSSLEPLASEPKQVRVEAKQVVHANSDEAARRDFEATLPVLTAHGADASLSAGGRDGANVDLKVTVPPGVAVSVRSAHGDVALSGLRRDVDVNLAHGDVTIDNAGGAVHLQMDHGDVTVHDVAGDLSIDGRADDVSISGVKGRSLMNGDFFGDTRLANVGGLVHFHSSRTDLDVPKLDGEMTLDQGNLRLVHPSGGIRVTVRSKDVEITDLSGDAHIEDNNGDLNVASMMPLGNLQLTNRTGAMTVTVPPNASFSVHGSANDSDELTNDFGLATESNGGRKTLTGQVGQGGPRLDLEANHGDLALRRGGSARAQAPEKPVPPAPPPSHPPNEPRRLHAKGEEPAPSVQ